jgi:hypothetical protein
MTLNVSPVNFPALVLNGNAAFTTGGNTEDNKTRNFAGVISGTGTLTYSMRRGTVISLNGNNVSWSGGFVANNVDLIATNYSRVRADNGGFGTGAVTINNGISLEILSGRGDTINNAAALHLNGTGRPDIRKLALNSNETVGQFWLDGVQRAAGAYTSASGLLDSIGNPLISGTGTLTVLTGPGGGTPYATWADGFAGLTDRDPTLDFDGGGLKTGIEWVVGGDPTDPSGDAAVAPTFDNTTDPEFFIFTHRRTDEANADASTTIAVEYGIDLGGWTAAVPGPNIQISVTDDGAGSGIDLVQVKIRRTLATAGKLFARLKVEVATP